MSFAQNTEYCKFGKISGALINHMISANFHNYQSDTTFFLQIFSFSNHFTDCLCNKVGTLIAFFFCILTVNP